MTASPQKPVPIRRVTLSDVARRADVHVTTVSMAMREHPRLPAATRCRLRQLAAQMGYRRDPKLQALVAYRQRKSAHCARPTVIYLTPREAEADGAIAAPEELLRGAARRAKELGMSLKQDRWDGVRIDPDGILGVVLVPGCPAVYRAPHLDWNRIAAVQIDGPAQNPVLPVVAHDYGSIIRLAAENACRLGYRRIGFVLDRRWDRRANYRWSAGFFAMRPALPAEAEGALFLYPLSNAAPSRVIGGKSSSPMSSPNLAAWLGAFRPDVVIGKQDAVVPQLARMRLKVPQDLAFIDVFRGMSDSWAAGVRQHHAELGAQAIDLLSAAFHDGKARRRSAGMSTLLSGSWCDGLSCPVR